jgi:hypothetical protein
MNELGGNLDAILLDEHYLNKPITFLTVVIKATINKPPIMPKVVSFNSAGHAGKK